jgi:hypothetical protein
MEPSTPPPDRPVWGPPRDPLISRTPPVDDHHTASRRRLTAHDVRRIGGLAALASSAAIVGYMATASAARTPAQAVVVVTATDPQPVAVATTPATIPAARTRQAPPQNQSNSSSHGS